MGTTLAKLCRRKYCRPCITLLKCGLRMKMLNQSAMTCVLCAESENVVFGDPTLTTFLFCIYLYSSQGRSGLPCEFDADLS